MRVGRAGIRAIRLLPVLVSGRHCTVEYKSGSFVSYQASSEVLLLLSHFTGEMSARKDGAKAKNVLLESDWLKSRNVEHTDMRMFGMFHSGMYEYMISINEEIADVTSTEECRWTRKARCLNLLAAAKSCRKCVEPRKLLGWQEH